MLITSQYLLKCGFEQDKTHLLKFYLGDGKKFRISIESVYFANSNKLGWSLMAWNTDEKGVINKRVQASVFTEVDEIRKCLEVVGLDKEIWG